MRGVNKAITAVTPPVADMLLGIKAIRHFTPAQRAGQIVKTNDIHNVAALRVRHQKRRELLHRRFQRVRTEALAHRTQQQRAQLLKPVASCAGCQLLSGKLRSASSGHARPTRSQEGSRQPICTCWRSGDSGSTKFHTGARRNSGVLAASC